MSEVLKAIAATAELTGTELSKAALKAFESSVSRYPVSAVLRALERCQNELSGRLTPKAVLDRIAEEDGRPAPDEAWAIALNARDETETVVWTDEMAQAFAAAQTVLDTGDKVGARMAFLRAYERLVREAREAGAPVRWNPSLGYDAQKRTVALEDAVRRLRLEAADVAHLLPAPLEAGPIAGLLTGNTASVKGVAPERLEELREAIDSGARRRAERRREREQAREQERQRARNEHERSRAKQLDKARQDPRWDEQAYREKHGNRGARGHG